MNLKKFIPIIPVILLMGYSLLNILQYGLFDIRGIQIPFTMFNPHATTVFIWGLTFILIYVRTEHLTWWLRIIVIMSFLSLCEFMTGAITAIIGDFVVSGSINFPSLFVGSSNGIPTFLTLEILVLVYLFSLHKQYDILEINKVFLACLFLFSLSIIILSVTGFFHDWVLYIYGEISIPPQSFNWLFFKITGTLLWVPLIKRKGEKS